MAGVVESDLGSSDLLLGGRLLEFATFRGRWRESPKRDPASAIWGTVDLDDIAKQIVVASGGTLDVRSGHGTTTFVMRLPRNARAVIPASPPADAHR